MVVCPSQVRPQVRSAAIMLFTELLNTVKRRQKPLLQEEVTRSLVPLLLHLQDEDPDVGKVSPAAMCSLVQQALTAPALLLDLSPEPPPKSEKSQPYPLTQASSLAFNGHTSGDVLWLPAATS